MIDRWNWESPPFVPDETSVELSDLITPGAATVWLLEEYDDPYVSPYTIGVFETKEQLVDTVNEEFSDAEIEWKENKVKLSFEIKSVCTMFSNKLIRKVEEELEFREVEIGVIHG